MNIRENLHSLAALRNQISEALTPFLAEAVAVQRTWLWYSPQPTNVEEVKISSWEHYVAHDYISIKFSVGNKPEYGECCLELGFILEPAARAAWVAKQDEEKRKNQERTLKSQILELETMRSEIDAKLAELNAIEKTVSKG